MNKINIYWKEVADNWLNLLSFLAILFTASVIFSIDNRLVEPNETAKFIKIVSIIPLLSISGIIIAFFKRSIKLRLLDLLSSLFLIYYLISIFIIGSRDPKHILLSVSFCTIYIIVRLTTSHGSNGLKWIALALLIVSIFELIIGITQVFGFASSNNIRYSVTGSFFNPGPFGGYLAFVFSLSLSILLIVFKKHEFFLLNVMKRKFQSLISIDVSLYYISYVALFLSIILLPASMSRSAWMSTCVVALIVFINNGLIKRIQSWISKRKYLIIPLLFISIVLVFSIIFSFYMLKKESADARLFLWQISAKVLAAYPITGVGVGYFGGEYANQQEKFFFENQDSKYVYVADCPTYAFNEYLQIGSELGLVGLALLAVIIVTALWNLFINPNPFHYGLISILVFAFTSYPFHIIPILILFVISIAAQESKSLSSFLSGRIFFIIILTFFFFVWILARSFMNDYIRAQNDWQRLKILYNDREIKHTYQYENIYSVLKYDYKFLFDYGLSLSKIGNHEKSNEIIQRAMKISCDPMLYNIMGKNYQLMKEYDLAEKSFCKASLIVPNRIYPHYLLMKLYVETGEEEKAKTAAQIVLTKEPKVMSTAVKEMRQEAKIVNSGEFSIKN